MPLSDYDYENRLSACANDAYNAPTRAKVEYLRELLLDKRAKKLLAKWDATADVIRELCDPVKGELIIRIGEAEATRKPEPKQALKRWVSSSRELKAALAGMPYFRDRYRHVTRSIQVKPLEPGFEQLVTVSARAFTKRLGRRTRVQELSGIFEQEFFYLAIDGEPEKVRDAALARALRDVIDEPVDGIDEDDLAALRTLAALVALGRWLGDQTAKRTTLSDDLESPNKQAKVPRIPALRSKAARTSALAALCETPASRKLFETLLTRRTGSLLAALSR